LDHLQEEHGNFELQFNLAKFKKLLQSNRVKSEKIIRKNLECKIKIFDNKVSGKHPLNIFNPDYIIEKMFGLEINSSDIYRI
jgi:hypothetical protein